MSTRLPVAPRERVMKAAADLFYKVGIRGVGMDAIAAAASTTKMAIYRNFESKDALVAEWVSGLTREYSEILDNLEATFPDDPRAQLIGLLDSVVAGLYRTSHRGCPFVNAIAELPDRSHPARKLIEAHKARQARRIARMCELAGIPDPMLAAAEITYLLKGAQIAALNRGIPGTDEMIRTLVMRVIDRSDTKLPKPNAAIAKVAVKSGPRKQPSRTKVA